MNNLICVLCTCAIDPVLEVPVVLKWGKKPKDHPPYVEPPILEAAHAECNREHRHPGGISQTSSRKAHPGPSAASTPPAPEAKGRKAVAEHPTGKLPLGKKNEARAVSVTHSFDGKKLYRIVKSNPRKEGTHGWRSWSLIKDGMTFEDYLKAGGRKNDLSWDVGHKFTEVQ